MNRRRKRGRRRNLWRDRQQFGFIDINGEVEVPKPQKAGKAVTDFDEFAETQEIAQPQPSKVFYSRRRRFLKIRPRFEKATKA